MATANELEQLWGLMSEAEAAVVGAIAGLSAAGFTWQQIGEAAGKSKSGVFRWYQRHALPAPTSAVST